MTRFTAIVLSLLLTVPAAAQNCPVPKIFPEFDRAGNCLNSRCYGRRLLRQAYERGEITTVHFSSRNECHALNRDLMDLPDVQVPCTWDHDW